MFLLTTGWNGNYELGNTENYVLQPSEETNMLSRCQLLPNAGQNMYALNKATGGVLRVQDQHLPIVCGGDGPIDYNDKCYHIQGGDFSMPTTVGKMRENRKGAASVAIFDGTTLWVTGGEFATKASDTTELIHVSMVASSKEDNPPTLLQGIPLPQEMAYHCLEMINSKAAILYGGSDWILNNPGYHQAWTIDNLVDPDLLMQNSWTTRATMKYGHYKHGCGVIKSDGEGGKFVVAAGGIDKEDMSTSYVEFLKIEEDSFGNVTVNDAWEEGPPLPKALEGSASATTEDQTILILAGGRSKTPDIEYSLNTYSLRCSRGFCWWTSLDTELLFNRINGIALFVPPANSPSDNHDRNQIVSNVYFVS